MQKLNDMTTLQDDRKKITDIVSIVNVLIPRNQTQDTAVNNAILIYSQIEEHVLGGKTR